MKEISNVLNGSLNHLEIEKDVSFACSVCKDTGYVIKGDVAYRCHCKNLIDLRAKQQRMGITPHMRKMTFGDFDYSFYSETKYLKNHTTYKDHARHVVTAARDFVASTFDGKETTGIFLQGDVGSGKTYLAASIANSFIEKGETVAFVVVPDFLDELRSTFQPNAEIAESDLMEHIKNAPILILDDLGAHNYTDWSINVLYTIVNYRVNYELPMVVTTNLKVGEIEELIGSRFCSRLMESCRFYQLVVDVDIRKMLLKRNTR